jgi:predicted ArsR family transcriptional regulator
MYLRAAGILSGGESMEGRGSWLERTLSGTRGRIVALLRREDRTVTELALELGLTDNAVRTHLTALEGDGLVERLAAARRGVGKPPVVYRATAAAHGLLPKGYAPVLAAVLDALRERMSPEELEAMLRAAGAEAGGGVAPGDLRERVNAAVELLGRLGGDGVVSTEGPLEIRGYSCPLGAVVPRHPELCALAESLVSAVVGVPVREDCERGERPRCRFKVMGDEL